MVFVIVFERNQSLKYLSQICLKNISQLFLRNFSLKIDPINYMFEFVLLPSFNFHELFGPFASNNLDLGSFLRNLCDTS